MVLQKLDCLLRSTTGHKNLLDPQLQEGLPVLLRNDSAAKDNDVLRSLFLEQLYHAREEGHVGTGQNAQADRINVLLDGRLDDLLRRAVQSGVNHLHARIAQRSRHYFCSPVMAVQPRLADENPYLSFAHGTPNRSPLSARSKVYNFQRAAQFAGLPVLKQIVCKSSSQGPTSCLLI